MSCYHVHSKIALRFAFMALCCFLTVFAVFPAAAQQHTAVFHSFNGEIIVVPASQPFPSQAQFANMSQGGEPAILAVDGDVSVISTAHPTLPRLQSLENAPNGYRIIARSGASATLTLPDGSQILIREMSIVELNGFAWNTQRNARGMLMSLYAGSVRVLLSQPYQKQETFFEIKTPNALVALHFSQPDVEVIYAPSPLEEMTALLEEDMSLEEEEGLLWQTVLNERERDVRRRQRPVKNAAIQSGGTAILPSGAAPFSVQETLAQIGVIQSEEDILLQGQLLQRDEDATTRLAQSIQPQFEAVQVAAASPSGLSLPRHGVIPLNLDLEQWQADGLITGEDEAGKGTTFVFAYTVSVSFMNRLTREVRTIQPEQRAVIRGQGITMTMLNGNPMRNVPPRNIGMVFEFDGQRGMPSLDKPEESSESSIQTQENAPSSWLFPGSSGRPELGGRRPRPHNVEIIIDE